MTNVNIYVSWIEMFIRCPIFKCQFSKVYLHNIFRIIFRHMAPHCNIITPTNTLLRWQPTCSICFILSCLWTWQDKGDTSWLNGEFLHRECNTSSQFFADIFVTHPFNFLVSHLSCLAAIPVLAMFAWPEACAVSLSAGVVSCGAASAGAGERDEPRTKQRGAREKAQPAGGHDWRAAGGDTPPPHHSSAVIPHTSLLRLSCPHIQRECQKIVSRQQEGRTGQDGNWQYSTFTLFIYLSETTRMHSHQYGVNMSNLICSPWARDFTNSHRKKPRINIKHI